VMGIVRRIKHELKSPAKVIATGGLSSVIAEHADVIDACEPTLVLDGIRLIYERMTGPRGRSPQDKT